MKRLKYKFRHRKYRFSKPLKHQRSAVLLLKFYANRMYACKTFVARWLKDKHKARKIDFLLLGLNR